MCFFICTTYELCNHKREFCRPYGSREEYPDCYNVHPALEAVAADIHWIKEVDKRMCRECDPREEAVRQAETAKWEETRMRREKSEGEMRRMVETWVKKLPDVEVREKVEEGEEGVYEEEEEEGGEGEVDEEEEEGEEKEQSEGSVG